MATILYIYIFSIICYNIDMDTDTQSSLNQGDSPSEDTRKTDTLDPRDRFIVDKVLSIILEAKVDPRIPGDINNKMTEIVHLLKDAGKPVNNPDESPRHNPNNSESVYQGELRQRILDYVDDTDEERFGE